MRALPIILLALLAAAAVVAALVLYQGDGTSADPALGHPPR